MKNRIFKIAILGFIVSLQSLLFQNCSKVQVADVASIAPAVEADRSPASVETALAAKKYLTRTGTLDSAKNSVLCRLYSAFRSTTIHSW